MPRIQTTPSDLTPMTAVKSKRKPKQGHLTESRKIQSQHLLRRGTLVSFPHMELYGIELFQLVSLSITVKCDHCKDTIDVSNIKDTGKRDGTGTRSEICKKCANSLRISFRTDLIHSNSIRAGYLDLDGCTVVDLLLSCLFIPTCAECSTPYPATGVVSVRVEMSVAFCQECHRKMTFRIPEVKFLLVCASRVWFMQAPIEIPPLGSGGTTAAAKTCRANLI